MSRAPNGSLQERLNEMNKLMIAAAAVAFAVAPAFADDDPSDDEVSKLKEAIAAWGCEGGEFEKETEGTGVYEAEDVKCKTGQYDFRLDKDFKAFVITAD
jgi:hypothetical protein